MSEDLSFATKVIQENRALPVRRESGKKVIFCIVEGHNRTYVRYVSSAKLVEPVAEDFAVIHLKDKVSFTYDGCRLVGPVVVIVPAKQSLVEKLDAFKRAGYTVDLIEKDLRRRQQISYLVAVGKRLYWPLTGSIRKIV